MLASSGGVFRTSCEEGEEGRGHEDMAARAVVQQPRGGENQKNVAGESRHRLVLQDIGNRASEPAAQAKPIAQISGPVTRSFEALLLAKPQVAARKSLTSVLTARSKAACRLANKPKDCLVDIDKADANDELAVVEYIDDIYKYYRLTEDDGRVHDYIGNQLEINHRMRVVLVDWLIELHHKFGLMHETLYLTVNIVDRYLSREVVLKRELQLVGISAMLIASKYEEIQPLGVNDLLIISDNSYVREQVLVMEKSILENLEWYLTVPTPYVFLIRYIKASIPSDKEMENMVFYLAELGLMSYCAIIRYSPSMIAASAVYTARCTLGKNPFWTETLKHHTGYSADQLMECAKFLSGLHSNAAESEDKAAHSKFSSPDRCGVALLAPAKSLSAEGL